MGFKMYHTSTHDRHVCLLRYVLQVAAKLQECTRVRTLLFIMISVIIFLAAGLARGLAGGRL